MSLADRIIDHGPYRGGDDNPFAGGVDYADLNDLRDRLITQLNHGDGIRFGRGVSEPMTEAEAWRLAHRAGGNFLANIEREMPVLATAVKSYRDAVEQVLAEAGYPVAERTIERTKEAEA